MKAKKNWFLRIIGILFIIFISLFISNENGFYEAKVKERTVLTDTKIKEFEKDLDEGKIVDINNYFIQDKKDYSNRFNKAGEKVSSSINKILIHGFKDIWHVFKVLFT